MASSVNFWTVAAVVTCVKFLFMPAYKSSDFEVHRNWLAITNARPVSKWYYEDTSEWTLDYPPLFAWFEYFLSYVAKHFDPAMLRVSNLNYASPQTVFFQRLSVIIADFIYIYGAKRVSDIISGSIFKKGDSHKDPWMEKGVVLAMLLLWNPGLLMIDHIHFQYNGFLYGFLLLSIASIMQDHHKEATFWFVLLLNLKHLYLYLAPAYFIYLLRNYCFQKSKKGGSVEWSSFSLFNFLQLVCIVVAVFSVSFGPFIWMGQLKQLLNRLFPFKRGLTHAYWAPNFWALYNTADRVVFLAANKMTISSRNLSASVTGGLITEYGYAVLPTITPSITTIFTLLSVLPALWILWHKPRDIWMFINVLVLCACGSFLFNWHVHEKAILMVVIPLTTLAVSCRKEAEIYVFLSTISHFSIFPLLFQAAETPIKILLLLLHTVYSFTVLSKLHRQQDAGWLHLPLLTRKESFYLYGLVFVQMYYSFGSKLLGIDKSFPFLPLLLFSAYSSCGIIYSWLKLYIMIYPMQDPIFVADGKDHRSKFLTLS